MKLELQRKDGILKAVEQQLANCKKNQSTLSIVAGDGLRIQMEKPKFETWAEWSKANQGKKFADFREAENLFLKKQIESVWAQIGKEVSDE